MKNKNLVLGLIVVVSLLTIPLGQMIWPPASMGMEPTQTQILLFMGVSLFEALSFGAGLMFVLSGWNYVKSASSKRKTLTKAAYVSIAWSLLSWWPHDRLHAHIGNDINKLLGLEYGFHVTLIIAAIIVAYTFYNFVLLEKK